MNGGRGGNGDHNEETGKTETNEEEKRFFVLLRYLRFFVVISVLFVTSDYSTAAYNSRVRSASS